MKLDDLYTKIVSELPEDFRKDISGIIIDDLVIGLKKKRIGYEQVFIAGGDNEYTTLFSTSKKYSPKLSEANRNLNFHYVECSEAAMFFFGKKINAMYCLGDPLQRFRKHIWKSRGV